MFLGQNTLAVADKNQEKKNIPRFSFIAGKHKNPQGKTLKRIVNG